jgi:hypothetical protein
MTGFYKHYGKPLGSVTDNFIDQLTNSQLFENSRVNHNLCIAVFMLHLYLFVLEVKICLSCIICSGVKQSWFRQWYTQQDAYHKSLGFAWAGSK